MNGYQGQPRHVFQKMVHSTYMRNKAFSGTEWGDLPSGLALISGAIALLRETLPSSWRVRRKEDRSNKYADAIVEIMSPQGQMVSLALETKRSVNARDIAWLQRQRETLHDFPLLISVPYVSPQTQELLAEAGICYVDATGNLRIALSEPSIFIYLRGASRDPWPQARSLKSLKGRIAGRVVRALCDIAPPYGVHALAEYTGASAASVSRVSALLDDEALIQRDDRGKILDVDWRRLILRWVDDYSLLSSNRIGTYLEPRGFDALLRKLARSDVQYAVSGSLAAAKIAPIAPPRLAAIYVPISDVAAERWSLRQVDSGANILLVEPFDGVVFDRIRTIDDVQYAAPAQVAADLLTSPGRGPAEGETLLEWMEANQDAWRH